MADTDPIRTALERLHEYALANPAHDTDKILAAARAELARWGRRESGSPAVAAVDVDVEEAAAALDQDGRHLLEVALARDCSKTWGLANRVVFAAALLRQLAAQAQPPQTAHPIRDAAERLQQVAAAERPWRRPGWCDTQGRCWMGDPGGAGYIAAWLFCVPEDVRRMSASLPADALPLPKLPSDPVANELSDEQLLQMAATAIGLEAIAPGQYEQGEFEGQGTAVEAYGSDDPSLVGSELIAYGRAVIAADRARREEKANG